MPYTRNTRIKQTKWKHKQTSEAQVEYRYPFTKITKWESFDDLAKDQDVWWILFKESLPIKAYYKTLLNKEHNEKQGEDWAKAIIDQYHKLLDDVEAVPEINYIKYPD